MCMSNPPWIPNEADVPMKLKGKIIYKGTTCLSIFAKMFDENICLAKGNQSKKLRLMRLGNLKLQKLRLV